MADDREHLAQTLGLSELYVAPCGNDRWSGRLLEPNEDSTDGPLATPQAAVDRIRWLRGLAWSTHRTETALRPKSGWSERGFGGHAGPIVVWLREGVYELDGPLTFTPVDGGPITFAAFPGETAVLDGGRRIRNWRVEEVNGVTAWIAQLPEVVEGGWRFRQLWVNGRRATRARLPKNGFYTIEDPLIPEGITDWHAGGGTRFRAAPDDIQQWHNLQDVEIVVLHYWIEERLPIASFDPDTRIVETQKSHRKWLVHAHPAHGAGNAPYYVDNVYEALTGPGEWYLDYGTGCLTYVPRAGEDPETAEVVAPMASRFLCLHGDIAAGQSVTHVRFRGLTFRYTTRPVPPYETGAEVYPWRQGGRGSTYGAANQASHDVPAAVSLRGAQHCCLQNCVLEHIGGYGIEVAEGCSGITITGNCLGDLGAGGIRVGGADDRGPVHLQTGLCRIADNTIGPGGAIFHSAAGILLMHSGCNTISHNHIHHFYWTGIQVGWGWNYRDTVIRENRIEFNHIHDIGRGWLSDIGGIYTLTTQPGTVIRGNRIHDITCAVYGANAIYLDDCTAHVLVEDNVCYRTNRDVLNLKGRENLVRNNVFAFGEAGIVRLARTEPGVNTVTFERNVVLTNGAPIVRSGYGPRLRDRLLISDLNVVWDIGERQLLCEDQHAGRESTRFGFEYWQKVLAMDRHSIIAHPEWVDLEGSDFHPSPGSAASQVGFQPFSLDAVGPRQYRRPGPGLQPLQGERNRPD